LDLSDILPAAARTADAIADYVQVVVHDGHTFVDVDMSGSGQSFETVFVLEGEINLSVSQLLSSDALIV
jgi:hypothetical protein